MWTLTISMPRSVASVIRVAARSIGAIVASGLAAFANLADADARKKSKKKKKCKGGAKKCGKKCIPSGDCCGNAECGEGGACLNGRCICSNGFVPCQNTCIPEDDCSADGCCVDNDCATGNPCLLGCCVDGACEQDTQDNGSVCGACSKCQSGVCTSQCTAGEQCLGNGSCATSCAIDANCPGCKCNNNEGPDDICRVDPGINCGSYALCSNGTTAECPAGTVCSDACGPGSPQCIPLC